MKISIKTLQYIGIALILVFSDILHNGNLNLLYIAGFVLIPLYLIKNRYFCRNICKYWFPLLFIAVIFLILTKFPVTKIKLIVWLSKMLINIGLFSFVSNNISKIRLEKQLVSIVACLSLLLFTALILTNSHVLWRLNDPYNNFSKTRLQLLFSEPSVLGLFVGVISIFAFYSFLEFGMSKRCFWIVSISFLCLLLSFSLSAITYTAISIIYLVAGKFFKGLFQSKMKLRVVTMVMCGGVILFFILLTDNPINNRVIAVLSNQDASFNHRWGLASKNIFSALESSHYLGIGFGNMNTPQGLELLSSFGMNYIFTNSFLYFIAEAGIMGIFYILFLLKQIFQKISEEKRSTRDSCIKLKRALFIYILISQIAGGYFTDPFIWCVYGIICAKGLKRTSVKIS